MPVELEEAKGHSVLRHVVKTAGHESLRPVA